MQHCSCRLLISVILPVLSTGFYVVTEPRSSFGFYFFSEPRSMAPMGDPYARLLPEQPTTDTNVARVTALGLGVLGVASGILLMTSSFQSQTLWAAGIATPSSVQQSQPVYYTRATSGQHANTAIRSLPRHFSASQPSNDVTTMPASNQVCARNSFFR